MQKEKERKNNNLTAVNIEELSKFIDGNTVVGKPITTVNNVTLIPVSKVLIAYLSGNGEYGKVNILSNKSHPSASGGGAIVNVNPSGFLCVDDAGCRFVKTNDDLVDVAFDKATQFIQKAIND